MFSVLNMLLVTRLLLMSDRDHFWETDKITKETVADKTAINPAQIKDKKVLLVVHGFNNTAQDALESYRTVVRHVEGLKGVDGEALYDFVIGYLWPGYDSRLEYYAARKHATQLKEKMEDHLQFLLTNAATIDVMAHSMGNRLMFEALNTPPKKKAVNNFYSLAAAVDNESLEKKSRYFHVPKNCNAIFIFYSKHDEVLEFLYALAEWDKALGFEGEENLKRLSGNMQLIDCTSFISGHSQYFGASALYSFIRSELLKQVPLAKDVQRLKMLASGEVEIIANTKK